MCLGLRAGLGAGGQFRSEPTGLLARGLGHKLAENVNRAALRKGEPLLRRGGELDLYALSATPSLRADAESARQPPPSGTSRAPFARDPYYADHLFVPVRLHPLLGRKAQDQGAAGAEYRRSART